MYRIGIVVVSLAVVVAGPALAAAGSVQPAFHEEAGRVLDQAAAELRNLGAQLEQHMHMGRGGLPGMPGGMMGPGRGPGSHGWMSPADRPLITIMLDHRTELELTPDQVTRLEGLRNDFARDAIRRGAEVRIAELDLGTLLEQDPPDMAKVEAKVREVAQLRADLRIARLRTIEQGKAVLTAEQKVRLQGMLTGGPMGPPRSAGTGTRL